MLTYMNKPITSEHTVLGLDLDGTSGDFHGSFRDTLIEHQGYSPMLMPVDVPSVYSYIDAGCFPDMDTFTKALHSATGQHVYLNMRPYDGFSEALNALHDEGMAIHVITSRPDDALEDTLSWLTDVAKVPFNQVTITHEKTRCGADVYLDDMPGHIEKFRALDRRAVIYDQPYNRHMDGERVTGWDRMADSLLRVSA